jgi:tRNA G18 (ribose-2'-O)-methylase SpoU
MNVKEIGSPQNPYFKRFLRILRGQGVKKQGLAFFSGLKQVEEILAEFPNHCEGIIFDGSQGPRISPSTGALQHYALSAELFREIDAFGTHQPVLIVRVPPIHPWDAAMPSSGCTLLIPFQDPSNVGAVIRSAAAFGVTKLVMLKESAHPFHYKSTRVAGSALLRIPIYEGPSIRELEAAPAPLITLSPRGQDIHRFRFPPSFLLLPGVEGPGLPLNLSHVPALRIPMERGVESLNAALATGIALYEWKGRTGKTGPRADPSEEDPPFSKEKARR